MRGSKIILTNGKGRTRELVFLPGRHEIRWQGGACAEEIVVHLFEEKLLSLSGSQVQPVFVHEHLHVLHPHLPSFFGDAFEDLLPERVAFERNLIEPFHLPLEFHAKHLTRAGADLSRHRRHTATTHSNLLVYRILRLASVSSVA